VETMIAYHSNICGKNKKRDKLIAYHDQGCFKLIKSDSEDMYNVTKDFYLINALINVINTFNKCK
jgi:hypothetical protein